MNFPLHSHVFQICHQLCMQQIHFGVSQKATLSAFFHTLLIPTRCLLFFSTINLFFCPSTYIYIFAFTVSTLHNKTWFLPCFASTRRRAARAQAAHLLPCWFPVNTREMNKKLGAFFIHKEIFKLKNVVTIPFEAKGLKPWKVRSQWFALWCRTNILPTESSSWIWMNPGRFAAPVLSLPPRFYSVHRPENYILFSLF